MWRSSVGMALIGSLAGCQQLMAHQPKYTPLAPGAFFADGRSARTLVAGTVPRTGLPSPWLAEGLVAGIETDVAPIALTLPVLRRGQQRFAIYCSPCHGLDGAGDGMIVRRGFPAPPSFHSAALRAAPRGHFVRVIAHGHGVMASYADRVAPADRWAIAAYARALQLSQNASLSDAPLAERRRLERQP